MNDDVRYHAHAVSAAASSSCSRSRARSAAAPRHVSMSPISTGSPRSIAASVTPPRAAS